MSNRVNRRLRALLGLRLRTQRKQHGLSQERLGDKAGLSGKFIGEVERGEKSISLDSLSAVSRVLDVPLHELLNFTPYSSPPDGGVEQLIALARRYRKQLPRLLAVCAAAVES